ncbi:MAG TPA: SOSS complex subunit B family protein [Kofleriaceae bacterium]|nr:SOSS complex subunit B family protein [Kofleriaceae bacterium]
MSRNKQLAGVLQFGDHHAYDGDRPWWTLRFVEPIARADRNQVAALLTGVDDADFELTWIGPRQCQLDPGDLAIADAAGWKRLYKQIDALLARIHDRFPLFAVMLQGGQFAGKGELDTLDDDALAAIKRMPLAKRKQPAAPRRKKRPTPPALRPISKLRAASRASVEGTVIALGKKQWRSRDGKSLVARDGVLQDASGSIDVMFWADDAKTVEVGMVIRIEDGWVDGTRAARTLSRGKTGTLVVVESAPPA